MLERQFLPITTPPKSDTPYGKKGPSSLAAQLASLIPENEFSPEPEIRYGEIWMGDHPSNPSSIILDDGTKVPLSKIISEEPERYLGVEVCKRFETTPSGNEEGKKQEETIHLPFLFKILSFDRPLPLQTHPDRALSAKLLQRGSKSREVVGAGGQLADHNYKPEVAVCIAEKFEGFIGFRPLYEIQGFLSTVSELRVVVGDDETVKEILGLKLADPSPLEPEQENSLLKRIFSGIIRCKEGVIAEQCQSLINRLDEHGDETVLRSKYSHLGNVIRKCLKDYPNDKGVFIAAFLMNYIVLERGEGAVVGVNEIHAYMKGDIIECMAWGDNMLAHGFTAPEERSSGETFISSVAFKSHSNPDNAIVPPSLHLASEPWKRSHQGKTTHYPVPMEEFDLLHIHLSHKDDFEEMTSASGPINGPLILLVTEGRAEIQSKDGAETRLLEKGRAVFVRPDVEWKVTAVTDGETELWGAFVEVAGEEKYKGRTYGAY